MELKRYLMVLLRRWWLILITLVVAVAATGVFTYLASPKYETTIRLVVSPSQDVDQDIREQRASLDTLNKPIIANTYAEIAQSTSIIEAAWEQLDDPAAQDEDFRDEFEVVGSVLHDTNIVVLTVTGPDPALVQQLATATSERTLDYVDGLYEAYDLKPLDSAVFPDEPISPSVPLNFALGTVLGLGTGALFVFLAEYLSIPLDQNVQVSLLDVKTGAYTGAYLLRRLREEISRSRRVQRPFAVGMIRLANSEGATAKLPPAARQAALKQVVSLVKQTLSEENLVAQWREHDLAILMPDCEPQAAWQTLGRLQDDLAWTPFEASENGLKLNLTAQVGLAMYDLDGIGPEELLAQAEQALQKTEYRDGES